MIAVFLEHHEGELQKGALGVLAKAAQLGDEVAGVVLGSGVKDLAAQAGRFGAAKVFVADDPALEAPLPQPRVDALAHLVREEGVDTVLFAASVLSADVAAGLAARLDAGLNWDLVDLVKDNGNLVGKRPALEDTVYVDVGWTSEPRLAMFRPGTFDPAESGGEAEVTELCPAVRGLLDAGDHARAGACRERGALDRRRRRDRRRRARARRPGELLARRGAGQGTRRCGCGHPRGGRRGLVPLRDTGRPDREDGLAQALHRVRHLRRDPAQGGHAGIRAS